MKLFQILFTVTALCLSQVAFADSLVDRDLGRSCQNGLSAVCIVAKIFSSGGASTGSTSIMQAMRDAMYHTSVPDSTTYKEGEHIICLGTGLQLGIPFLGRIVPIQLSTNVGYGAICVFAEQLKGGTVTLGKAKQLADALLQNKCDTCGLLPVGWPSDQNTKNAILKFDFTSKPLCQGNCITNDKLTYGTSTVVSTVQSIKTVSAPTVTQVQTRTQTQAPTTVTVRPTTITTANAVINAASTTSPPQATVTIHSSASKASEWCLLALALQVLVVFAFL